MLDRLFNRPNGRSGQPGVRTTTRKPAPRQFPRGKVCGAGDDKTSGYRCSFTDKFGQRCGFWCEDHSVFLNGRMWCERHANSVKWLRARDGTIYEIGHQAALNDRSPNLAGILVDELNQQMTAHLKSCFEGQRGVYIVTDAHVRTASIPKGRVEHTPDGPVVLREGGATAWERGWGVYNHGGYLARVTLKVTSTEPPIVHVFANGMLVLSRVPDWIANRGQGSDAAQHHESFRNAVMQAVKQVVVDPHDEWGE